MACQQWIIARIAVCLCVLCMFIYFTCSFFFHDECESITKVIACLFCFFCSRNNKHRQNIFASFMGQNTHLVPKQFNFGLFFIYIALYNGTFVYNSRQYLFIFLFCQRCCFASCSSWPVYSISLKLTSERRDI